MAGPVHKHKIFIVGLDGATFDVIKPLVSAGRLPNIAKVMASGVHCPLLSTIHPITPQAWSSFLTGKNAGKHGIFDFASWKKGTYELEFVNASRRKAQSIFRLLSDAGKTVGAIGIPFTFPPEKVNGFMLSGIDAPAEDERAVYPPELYQEIKKNIGAYYIHLASPVGRTFDPDGFRRDMLAEDLNRTDVSLFLMNKYACDLFVTVYSNTDRSQHQFLSDGAVEGYGDYKSIVFESYESADRQLGRIMARLDDDTTLIIMSDHGAGPIKGVFYLNRWLHQHGLLSYKVQNQEASAKLLEKARFLSKRFLPRWAKNLIKSRIPGIRDKVESRLFFAHIDWANTEAYGFGMYGNIYINLKGREPNGKINPGREYENLRDHIIESLSDLKDPRTGEAIIERIYRREELYKGSYSQNAPDLLIRWRDYSYYTSVNPEIETGDIFGPCRYIDSSEYRHVGTHRLEGIFMAAGKNIIKKSIANANILDIAPTVLYLLGQPIPEDMDGAIIKDMFSEKFLRMNPPIYGEAADSNETIEPVSYSSDEEQEVRERLKGLGYIE